MQYEISDPAAVAFARGFYAAIVRGRGIDDAVSSGRVAILGLSDRTLEWVTPVLYLRGHDSQLFTLPAPAEDTSPESASRDDTDSSSRGQRDDTSRTTPYASAAAPPHLPVPVRVPPAHLAHTLTGHDGSVWEVAFSPDGRLLATASGDKTAQVWDPATGEHLRTLTGHDGPVLGVAFSPDGRLLATASYYDTAQVWD
jgi:WD40 repeat protein